MPSVKHIGPHGMDDRVPALLTFLPTSSRLRVELRLHQRYQFNLLRDLWRFQIKAECFRLRSSSSPLRRL